MQRTYSDRESFGPEFDNRLIRLVKANPAIYDVSHKHYRRNPIRVAIWDKIATELNAPSKFLQTKWKNIRYNYLQEIKCLETGHTNANIRKRRFTEDLSFLQNTAQTYNVKKGMKNPLQNSSDNDSNSLVFAENDPQTYNVIEIEHSEDGTQNAFANGEPHSNGYDISQLPLKCDLQEESDVEIHPAVSISERCNGSESVHNPDVILERKPCRRRLNRIIGRDSNNSVEFYNSHSTASSPLMAPIIVMGHGMENDSNDIVTIEPIHKDSKRDHQSSMNFMKSLAKRKALHTPYPMLSPINDPIELYCLSLVDSLRSMPRSERERVKFEFAKILKDAQYKDES